MSELVENQYREWVYPLPVEDMRDAIATGKYWEIGDPQLYWPLFWPQRRNADKLDILVAGCGTNQAAYYACRNPSWNVLGVDLSESSLAHQQKLKDKHGLSNLRLMKLNLTQIGSLGESFDFITSTGVLHHLPNPDEGLAALKSVLRPEGVMNLMLYGTSLRLGVYLMQEVFSLLGLQQTKADVDLVRTTIESLPADHVVKRYANIATDLHYDAGVVDTFLHRVDQSYYVKDIYAFARRAGLEFLTWCDPGEYSLPLVLPSAHPLWPRLQHVNAETKAHICDLLTLNRGTHRFALAHPAYVQAATINFEDDSFFDHHVIPHRALEIVQAADASQQKNALVKRENVQFEIDYRLTYLMTKTDGKVSIRQGIDALNLAPKEKESAFSLARAGFKALWERGHIYILKSEVRN